MKKWLVAGFLLMVSMSFAASTNPSTNKEEHGSVGDEQDAIITVVKEPTAEVMGQHQAMMDQYLTAKEKDEVAKNRAEVKTLLDSKKPDWKKIESLNEKNALIMAKAKTKMMQEKYKK